MVAIDNLGSISLTYSQGLRLMQSQTLPIADWKHSMKSHAAEEALSILALTRTSLISKPPSTKEDKMASYCLFRLTRYCCHTILRATRLASTFKWLLSEGSKAFTLGYFMSLASRHLINKSNYVLLAIFILSVDAAFTLCWERYSLQHVGINHFQMSVPQ